MSMKSIICFAAHPDDLEFGCTGTVRKLILQGYDVVFVIVTNGENGWKGTEVPRNQRIAVRKAEQLKSAEKLGVNETIFLDYQDGFLEYTEMLRRQLVEIIKKYKPEFVFSFDPANQAFSNLNLYHRDHRIVAEVVFDACFAAKNRLMYPGEVHRVTKLYFYASEVPDHFEDITDQIDLKLELLACHRSQFPDFSKVEVFIRDEVSKQTDLYPYSEAFRILEVRQIT